MSLPRVGTETASPECRATLWKRRLGTQRRATGGVAASGPCLEEFRVHPQTWARESCGLGPTRIREPDYLAGDSKSGKLDGYQFLCLPLAGSGQKKPPDYGW